MKAIKWIFRIIKALLFGGFIGFGCWFLGTLVFGLMQLFLGWSKATTEFIIGVAAVLPAIWGVYTMVRIGIEDDKSDTMLTGYKKAYKDRFGEEYYYEPDEDDEPLPTKSKRKPYTHTDRYGMYTGASYVRGNSADHYSPNGYSASYRSGNEVIHYSTDGYHGSSHVSKDGKTTTHYGKDNLPCGYSKKKPDGSIDHYDKWGIYTGTSRPE